MLLQAEETAAGAEGNTAPVTDDIGGLMGSAKDWLTENGPDYAMRIVTALLVLLIGWWVAKMLRGIVRKILSKKVDSTLTNFLCNILYMVLMVLVIISALGQLGVATTSFVAILGAAGLAIGFALQGSLGNFAAGVMLMAFRPFKEADFVEVAGLAGVVLEVGVFATILKTPDNKRVTVPNSAITDGNIVNYSAHDTRRVDMVFGIGYSDDIKAAKELLEQIVQENDQVLSDPAPVVAVSELADSSVNFVVRPWVKTADYWDVYWATHEAVKLRFDAAGISIPFPQQDVHMHEVA